MVSIPHPCSIPHLSPPLIILLSLLWVLSYISIVDPRFLVTTRKELQKIPIITKKPTYFLIIIKWEQPNRTDHQWKLLHVVDQERIIINIKIAVISFPIRDTSG